MEKSIFSFPDHILDALKINNNFFSKNKTYSSVVIAGQGGSAIGGYLIFDLLDLKNIGIPVFINKGYTLPSWVNTDTLLIISSYSGNTEETISVLNQGIQNTCQIVCLCSGGQILDMAKKNRLEYLLLPKGFQPRVALAYSIVQLFQILCYKKILNKNSDLDKDLFIKAAFFLKENQDNIVKKAHYLVDKIKDKNTIMYCSSNFFASALRFKQQLNENAKSHCWFNIIPEMNHNEIVAWSKKYNNIFPLFISTLLDINENKKRISLTIKHVSEYSDLEVIIPEGDSLFFQTFYLIHLFDFISIFLAKRKGIDPSKIDAIDQLKAGLKNDL